VPGSLLRIKYSIQIVEKFSSTVTKNNKRDEKAATKSRVNVGKLQLSNETIKDLTPDKQKQVQGRENG